MKKQQSKSDLKELAKQFFSIKSILSGLGGIILLLTITSYGSYDWVINTMLKKNWEIIKKYPRASIDQRKEMKLGFTYVYLNFLKNSTPEDAIILFPPDKQIVEKKSDVRFIEPRLGGKYELTYFLYPRKVLLQTETKNPLYGKETHVAIVNGYGYEYLDYEVADKQDFYILPKNKPN